MEPTLGFDAVAQLSSLAADYTGQLSAAGPVIGTVLVAIVGLKMGIRIFKFITSIIL